MPTTRKKIIKTVYKNEDDSDNEEAYSDSGSDAQISEESSSDEEEGDNRGASSGEDFVDKKKASKQSQKPAKPKIKFAKTLFNKIKKQMSQENDNDTMEDTTPMFSIKDMSEQDKLLPSVLNLSESDSSDDETQISFSKNTSATKTIYESTCDSDSDNINTEYNDVWSKNTNEDSEEIARKAFLELEQHKSKLEVTKASIHNYTSNLQNNENFDVKDLLAQGEEVLVQQPAPKKKGKSKLFKDDSDSEMEDWEEVKESKLIPQQGLQLIVEFPGAVCRKSKKLDVEMMMKRKINRVKKEYQVYMHKVHLLCWLGHGNYVSKVLNDQELLAAALLLVPSKECYPGERVDMKYLEQITTWYKDKLTLKQDKNENKFRPKAPPLKDLLCNQIKSRVVTTRKYLVYIFVCMLRALGLQCRVMFNFVTLPIRPPSSELCSLSTKPKDDKTKTNENINKAAKQNECKSENKKKSVPKKTQSGNITQLDGADDYSYKCHNFYNISQLDGNDDSLHEVRTRSSKVRKPKDPKPVDEDDVSPPKRSRKSPSLPSSKNVKTRNEQDNQTSTNAILKPDIKDNVKKTAKGNREKSPRKEPLDSKLSSGTNVEVKAKNNKSSAKSINVSKSSTIAPANTKSTTTAPKELISPRKTIGNATKVNKPAKTDTLLQLAKKDCKLEAPQIVVTNVKDGNSSKYFSESSTQDSKSLSVRTTRKRSRTTNAINSENSKETETTKSNKTRTKSEPGVPVAKSKYFVKNEETTPKLNKKAKLTLTKKESQSEDHKRVSHRDLTKTRATTSKNDVTGDLVDIIKDRIREAKAESKKGIVKGKLKKESDEDSDYLPVASPQRRKSANSDDEFKPSKISSRPSTSKKATKVHRRVLSSDEDTPKNKIDVWCEVFVEELEQWIPVDVIKGTVHCAENIYTRATHPVCYIVGWDNNNYLKDLTRRYVPHWNTVTRKQRADPAWWNTAVNIWLAPKSAREREEDEQLDRMQLEAPLPKSIGEYKNHPLYALKRHLLKFEALYPPDAAVLGFVRKEPVYARECVYVCRSRDTWLKEAKVVKLGETPYKVVKARPKWDKLSNKLITDKPLEIFGPWQVQDYEPPVAENGIVPRNAYGNVELFKDCMLPKGTVHIKLPGLNKVAKKLNIDCAPAMTGFDFNGGWSHPVFDGFVVCKEYEEIITEAWVKDQEDQERREREKIDARVYGNWRRLIKGLFIRERLKVKYGFEEPSTSEEKKKSKGPRLVVKKK